MAYSNNLSVTTLTPQVPTVTTDSVSMYNECLATVVSDGGAPILQRGFCYDTLPNPTLENGVVTVDGGVGEFNATLSGLPIGKLYFVRAFATNAKGTTYGNQFDFYAGCDMKTLTDYDGNVYNTVLIGNQCWMKENLRTTHYSDGWPMKMWLCMVFCTTGKPPCMEPLVPLRCQAECKVFVRLVGMFLRSESGIL